MKRRGVRIAVVVVLLAVLLAVWWQKRAPEARGPRAASAGAVSAESWVVRRDPGTSARVASGDAGVVTPVKTRRIAGVVVDERGVPLAGVRVSITPTRAPLGARDVPSVTSDERGAFDFGAQPSEAVKVSATSAGLTPATALVMAVEPASDTEHLRLVMSACDAVLHGVVRDNEGGVIAGATVALHMFAWGATMGVESTSDGRYELCIPRGGSGIVVTADGYALEYDHANGVGRIQRDYRLSPGTTLTGRVIRAADESGVAGAHVTVRRVSPFTDFFATTANDGTFSLDGLSPGPYEVMASGMQMSFVVMQTVVELGGANHVVVELEAAAAITGRVVERGSERPVRTKLTLTNLEDGLARGPHSASDGTFRMGSLLPGDYELVLPAYVPALAPRIVSIRGSELIEMLIEVPPRGSIAGLVLHQGRPVEGAQVYAKDGKSPATTSDATGQFLLEDLDAGALTLYAQSERAGAFSDSTVITLGPQEHRTGVAIELDLAASVAGTVVDQNGAPVPDAFVKLLSGDGTDIGFAITAGDGTFLARAMKGGGAYTYEVREREGSPFVIPPASGAPSFPPLTIANGSTKITGHVIAVRLERRSISGRVVDAAGLAVPDAQVVVRAVPTSLAYRAPSTTTDVTGAFTLRDLAKGVYSLDVSSTRGTTREDNVAAGRADLRLRVLPSGSVTGTLVGFTGRVDVNVISEDYGWPATVTGSSFRAGGVPPGTHLVVASSATGDGHASVTVGGGEAANVTIAPRVVGTIHGTLVEGESRTRVANAQCTATDTAPSVGRPELRRTTSGDGVFELARVTVGTASITCTAGDRVGTATVSVTAGGTSRVEITLAPGAQPGQ